MNEQQLETAKTHFEELKYGMKNIDVKALGLRSFCKYVQRKRNKKVYSLYALTDEWTQYVEERIHADGTSTDKPSDSLLTEKLKEEYNPLLTNMERTIINGECHLESAKERFELISHYYEMLRGDGMNESEIVRADLVGILG